MCSKELNQFFWVGFELCPLMLPHTLSLKEFLYLSYTEDLVLDLCPEEYCMFISCMLHPSRRNWSRGRRQSGSNASTSSHCVTLSVSFSHFHPPCFIPSPSKHFISSSTPIHFFFFRWLYFEHWFPIPDWRVTAAPHLIIHEMQLEKKLNCFFIVHAKCFCLFVCFVTKTRKQV